MSIRSAIVVTALILALGVGIGLSQAGGKRKHSHGVPVKQVTQNVSIASGGVDGQIAFCPKGWKATGGGVTGDGSGFPLIVNSGLAGKRGFEAIIVNDGTDSARMSVKVACVRSTTKVRASIAAKSDLLADLRQRVAKLRQDR